MYAIDITLFSNSVSSVISVLSSTMAGMSFMFITMFFLAGIGTLALCLAELLEVNEGVNLLADTCLGLLKTTANDFELNSTQRLVIESLSYYISTLANEDVWAGYTLDNDDFYGVNLNFREMSLNECR